ncbi:T9SS type A sorting domain-containing protein [Hymenobacter sp. PAMC 26628]|uniref:T9SS type A sorting domain-containing protein n=1 Tax=Hymenobacter sp. PAMC 26628 TaxID=1484118 RepID=UPI0012FFB0A7|nr:T9SS type A sorting domain-containing protein [Hymenobacter sp. PAMC 26628]
MSPDWHQVDLSDAPSAALTATYQANAERYLNNMGTAPIPDGGFQDWVYNTDRDELVAYIGTSNHFLTIANPATQPVARTTAVAVPIPNASGAPGSQNIGALFTDNLHNVYAISAQDGIIYQIDHLTGDYLGKSYGAFGCSRGDAVSLPGATPITLASFEAASTSNAVLLDWTTTSEFSAASFEVQRSSTRANWTTIQTQDATVQAAGAAYRITDATPLLGLAYYRLALRYPDGRLAYSLVRAVKSMGTALAVAAGKPISSSLQVFPNPAHGSLAFTLPAGDVSTSVDLVSATGQLARHYAPFTNGSTHSLDIQGLPKGFYLLRVQLAGAVRTARVVLAP